MNIPVRRGTSSEDKQMALQRREGAQMAPFENNWPPFTFADIHREMEEMHRRLLDFRPFDMFSCWGDRNSTTWFRDINERMRNMHNDMLRFMRESGMPSFSEDWWCLPNMADCFTKDANGQTWFRIKFNLQSFDPEDIEVRVDDQLLSVQAKHSQRGSHSSSSQYFCRAMLLPDGVLTEKLKSALDKDGILTVEAPAPGVDAQRLYQGQTRRIPIEEGGRRKMLHDRRGHSRTRSRKENQKEYITEHHDGSRSLNITMPIDDIYSEEDLHVRLRGGHLIVEGERGDNRFSRSFPVPRHVDTGKLDAKLCNGVVTINGPVP
uniref:SHSP domain-containing protein n=1 Tax=Mesocestoides corti TaxID=53468 RepID=A0A5K3EJA5_MESCO